MTKNVLMTSGNRGIGLELAKIFHDKGYKIYAICRSSSDELRNIATDICDNIDLTDFQQISRAQEYFCDLKVDILLNIAGELSQENIFEFDRDTVSRIKYQFALNSVAPIALSAEFLDNLNLHSKIVMITSRMGSIDDNSSGSRYGYRMSKSALNAASKSLAVDLLPRGIAVGIFHPGWVKTQMTNYTGHLEAEQSAAMLEKLIDSLSIANSGKFFHANGEEIPW